VMDTPLNDVALMAALRSPMVGADIDTLYLIVEFSHGNTQTNAGCSAEHAATVADVSRKPADVRMPVGAQSAGTGSRARQAGAHALPLYIAAREVLKLGTLSEDEARKLTLFFEVMDSLREQEDRLPVGQLMERLISLTSYDARILVRPNGRRRLANVRKLLQMANSDPILGVRDFIRRLRDLEKLSDREGDAPTEEEAADVVRFHTIHGAKGLEFPVVILADLCRSLEHPERGLFVCDPNNLALGTRICGAADAVYRAIDHRRLEGDREEAERLLYVAMTRAREHLVLCGNLGRSRSPNWGDHLFPALGINEAPLQPVTRMLIGGVGARLSSLSSYFHNSTPGGAADDTMPAAPDPSRFADSLAEALLNDQPLEPAT